jgi:hypothetical protein
MTDYIALRSMKVQLGDRTFERRKAGDPILASELGPNPGAWVRRGWVKPDDGTTVPSYDRSKWKPPVPATAEDKARGANAPVPRPGEPLPGYDGQGNVQPAVPTLEQVIKAGYPKGVAHGMVAYQKALADGGTVEDADAAAREAVDAWLATNPDEAASEEEGNDLAELLELNREQLDTLAETEYGIEDAKRAPNKTVLAQAIIAKRAAQAAATAAAQ